MYIADQESLVTFVDRARTSSVLAIDTEFLREKTYYPKLCLLQLATDDDVAIIDPFTIKDLSVIVALMENEEITKLFHAGSQDLEILYNVIGVLPEPIFDTQLAAALIGQVYQISLASLVNMLCGITLKKSDSFTDWTRRPLTESQLAYAADDVIYLPRIYRILREKLKALGRLSWLENDFSALANPTSYTQDPRERFRHLKRVSSLNRKQLAAAREVAAWREVEAQKRDLPRKWIISDEQIVEICKREPRTIDDLFMVRGVREKLTVRDARAVVAAVARGFRLPRQSWPTLDQSNHNEPNVDMQLDLMNALVRLRAKQHDIAIPTLASHSDLTNLARGHKESCSLLQGWRKSIVGDDLVALLEGKIGLSLVGKSLKVTNLCR